MTEIKEYVFNEQLEKEINKYESKVKDRLRIEERIRKLKTSGKTDEEIKVILGNDSYIFEYVPEVLYHGSPNDLDIINANESTQKGSFVYATDNPVHALFFSIFRNSSIVRAHIDECIDENGNYKVKYIIDERVQGALNSIIANKEINIYVCKGEQFFKPQGEAYIRREWLSKDGQNIVPMYKIKVNIKQFFESLEKKGLVTYDRYDKSKDWKTVIDLLGRNYPYGLFTTRGNDIQEYDSKYDKFIEENFPEQLEFSIKFREFIKTVAATNYKLENPNMTEAEEYNYKLKYIKSVADSFLLAQKDKNGKIKWSVDIEKINAFLNHSETFYSEIL